MNKAWKRRKTWEGSTKRH